MVHSPNFVVASERELYLDSEIWLLVLNYLLLVLFLLAAGPVAGTIELIPAPEFSIQDPLMYRPIKFQQKSESPGVQVTS